MDHTAPALISLFIIDDHPLVSGGIAMMLQDVNYLQIVATAATGKEALEYLEHHQPDVILLDISLPDTDGLQLCETIRQQNNHSRLIGLTSANEVSIITQFLHRGGNGYLLKNMEREELLDAIEKVLSGKIYLSRSANDKVLEQFASVSTAVNTVPTLTRREKEILLLLHEGLNGPQIAEKLFLSTYTVETHRKNMLQKFGAGSTPLLLKMARDYRLIN